MRRMLFTKKTAEQKRADLRVALNQDRSLRFLVEHAAFAGMALERHGFDGLYIAGAAFSAWLGLPDIGLTTLSEVAEHSHRVDRVVDIPTIVDADTGFGEPMSAARTVRMLEEHGVAGCHIEDQVNPKRCGHLDGKEVVPRDQAARRIKAAAGAKRDANFLLIARTDAAAIEGIDSAIDRAKAYVDAGAEMIFAEAMRDLADFETFCTAVAPIPVLANMTEFGKSELFSVDQLHNAGVKLIIYPVTSLRLMMRAVEDGFSEIKAEGRQTEAVTGRMQTRKELYDLIRYEDYNNFDTGLFNFTVTDKGTG